MTLIQFTKEDRPPRPLQVNPEFVATVEPRRKLLPNQSTQGVHLENVFAGAKITMASGEWYNVQESYQDVLSAIGSDIDADQIDAGTIPLGQVPGLVPVSNAPTEEEKDVPSESSPVLENVEPASSPHEHAPIGGVQVEGSPVDLSSTKVGVDDAAQEQEKIQKEQKAPAKKAPAKKPIADKETPSEDA